MSDKEKDYIARKVLAVVQEVQRQLDPPQLDPPSVYCPPELKRRSDD